MFVPIIQFLVYPVILQGGKLPCRVSRIQVICPGPRYLAIHLLPLTRTLYKTVPIYFPSDAPELPELNLRTDHRGEDSTGHELFNNIALASVAWLICFLFDEAPIVC